MLSIVCVLKSGGDYSPIYVRKLKAAVTNNLTIEHRFICLTDIPDQIDCCETILLKHNWPGWWSKIELFRPDLDLGQVLFFDLDTLIIDNIDNLAKIANRAKFIMLRGFNMKVRARPYLNKMNMASGIMAGRFSEALRVYTDFLINPQENMNMPAENWMHGDQGFIAKAMGTDVPRLQDFLPENYIVGKRITNNGEYIPAGTRVIAWSGRPRLHTIIGGNIAKYW